ncbi:MAG: glycosyltransferase [Candidatus Marinimicrobia bacterium]|nr:glycosyltransferase [Candidatus Neomarinimicrobiota bacterium]MDD5541464.1 glycosyltransferase [Candidatus Neomarinimicrobiota bacterium]
MSVIIPMYNEEKTLHQIFTKVRQAPIEKEIIIVDSGSTDGTRTLRAGKKIGRRGGFRAVRCILKYSLLKRQRRHA